MKLAVCIAAWRLPDGAQEGTLFDFPRSILFQSQERRGMPDAPKRSDKHKALSAFLGVWTSRGTSYGGTDQSAGDPKANGEPWLGTCEGRWHTGSFFLIQDERVDIAGARFDTLSVMGVGEDGRYFARSFENHGFYRDYEVRRSGDEWKILGESERATIRFSEDGKKQEIHWEWKPEDKWLPLCDQVSTRVD